MPKLRRLSGQDVVRILERFGFVVIRIRGSHHILRRVVKINGSDGKETEDVQTVNVPVHGRKPLGPGMLRRIYRDTLRYISAKELEGNFYTD
jgi:predicted RNA binding protein YcfA (HicA-like mRNA interferase family)